MYLPVHRNGATGWSRTSNSDLLRARHNLQHRDKAIRDFASSLLSAAAYGLGPFQGLEVPETELQSFRRATSGTA